MDLAAKNDPKLDMALSAFVARTAMLRGAEFPTIGVMLIAIITRKTLQGEVLQDDPALLSEHDAKVLGGVFHACLVRSTSNSAAVQSFLRLVPLRKLTRTNTNWLGPMLEAIAEVLAPGTLLGGKGFRIAQKATKATAAFALKSQPSANRSSVSPSLGPFGDGASADMNQVDEVHSASPAERDATPQRELRVRVAPATLTLPAPEEVVKYSADSAQGTAEGDHVPHKLGHAASFGFAFNRASS